MTAQDLHDALNLLPSDLITATDKLRTAERPKVIPWRRWVSLAAVLVVVVGSTVVFQKKILPEQEMKMESMAQAPAAAAPMAPAPVWEEIAADEAAPEAPAEEAAAPKAPAAEESGQDSAASTTNENSTGAMGGVHRHSFAEPEEAGQESPNGYCGNTLTTVYLEEMNFTLAGSYSIAITDILIHLDYDPALVCRCVAEFAVDTETIAGIEVNLTEGFARCHLGQAALTEAQAKTIQEIIDSLE